jgi:predicted phage terminase large subunit-like protein
MSASASARRLIDRQAARRTPLAERVLYGAYPQTAIPEAVANVRAFPDWLPSTAPTTWDFAAPHIRHVCDVMHEVTSGHTDRVMFFMPPRHGKSEMVTVRYAAWRLCRDPLTRVVIAAYGQTLAEKFSRKVRRILIDQGIRLSAERNSASEWETAAGGGLRATGLGSGITGMGFDLLLIDDPVKSREEADSEAYRERAWQWYTDDLYTRREPGAVIVLTLTRWHEDDLAGRILDSEDAPAWRVVNLPAEAEGDDALGREPGEPLWPARFPLAELARIRTVLGRSYFALYQQRPLPAEGGMIKRDWLQIADAVPPGIGSCVRYWDKAGTDGDGDYTCGVLLGKTDDGKTYVLDVVRGQWSAGERERTIRQTTEMDGKRVTVWIEQEPGSGGKESAAATILNLAGYVVYAEPVTGEKSVRAEPFAAQAEAGNVRVLRAAWTASYIAELTSFPAGKHDDQVDATSGAFNKLHRPIRRLRVL